MAEDYLIKNDWGDDERRAYERYSVELYLEVFAGTSEALVGQVIDISFGGMRILCQEPLSPGAQMDLRLEVSLESGLKGSATVEVTIVWAREDDNPGSYVAGVCFADLGEDARTLIGAIIDELQ